MIRKAFFYLLIGLATTSCDKLLLEDGASVDPYANFDHLWETLDRKYAFFTYKDIDWQQLGDTYRGQLHAGMDEQALFDVLAAMLYELRDGHVNLESPFDRSRHWDWFLDFPPNYNRNIIDRNYLGKQARYTGPLANTVIQDIGYIHYSSFAEALREEHIDFLIDDFKNLKGIIVDVRSNGGGSVANSRMLASRFADRPRRVMQLLVKRGVAHDDFYPPLVETLEPAGDIQFTRPVVVLMNRLSYSATNDFILKMSAFPHVTLIGDQSGGGGGIPVDNELPNGWQFRYSTTITLSPNGFNVEHGIEPDIYIEMNPHDEANGIDSLIQYALAYILAK